MEEKVKKFLLMLVERTVRMNECEIDTIVFFFLLRFRLQTLLIHQPESMEEGEG